MGQSFRQNAPTSKSAAAASANAPSVSDKQMGGLRQYQVSTLVYFVH